MYLVTVHSNFSDIKEECNFANLSEASSYLYNKGYIFDSDDVGHYWYLNDDIYATVELKNK